jgi:hypothetical protein
MNNTKHQEKQFLFIKIVQSGESIKISLTEKNLPIEFKEIYLPLLQELKLKQKNVYISNEDGKMIGNFDFNLPLEEIIQKFGNKLKLYYEKVI